ncbi:MAG TPA: ATP-dependent helicase [Acidimicrobiales bacterium]|nr:ATP-dependent helicase [Acidimicrobiales bacterium]
MFAPARASGASVAAPGPGGTGPGGTGPGGTGPAWDRGLDAAQLAVATHGAGPLLVIAGAGTGKTRALISRVAYLLQGGTSPERILLLTFTRRAADEMLARAARLVGASGGRRPWGGTFHAVAHRFVSAYAEVIGFPSGFSVLAPSDACDLMELMRTEHGLSGTAQRFPRTATLVDIYSRCINTSQPLSDILATDFPWCEPHRGAIAQLFSAFTASKRSQALADFDDLLLYWRALLAHEPLGRQVVASWDYVLVDEYQDLNRLQVDIVRLLRPSGQGLMVVGDEAQAIYGFRGGSAECLRDAVLAFPASSVVRLERNFRSVQGILDVANSVGRDDDVARVVLRSDRGRGARPVLLRCHDAHGEARSIVDRVLQAHERGIALREQAVLVRAAHHSDLVELELSARGVPFRKYGGLRFLEASHVKDFVAAARLLDNPHDQLAWYRLLRLHDDIGPARARDLVAMATGGADRVADWAELVAAAPARARGSLSFTLETLARARQAQGARARAELVVDALRPLLASRYVDAPVRLADIERLAAAAGSVPELAAWLAELTLDPPEATGDLAGPPHLDEDYLVVSTIHSAKGLEWAVVHIPHVVDGCVPSDLAVGTPAGLAEERRLLYVAVTRARDELYLYSPLRLHFHRQASDDRHAFAALSRFLDSRVCAALDVVDEAVERPDVAACGRLAAAVSLALEDLWR